MKNDLKLIYILPNLFTAASAFLGVISIFAAVRGEYEKAIIYIVFSLICDGLDGRVARLTKTTSKFGVEFDSLADIVAFGVAPAVLFYYSVGHHFGRLGSLVAALFVVFGAIRLARFNVTSSNIEPNVLKATLNATTEKRGSTVVVKDYRKIMDTVRRSEVMQKQWDNYQKDFEYAMDIAFEDACDTVVKLMDSLIDI